MAQMIVQQPQPFMVATSNNWSSGICDFCDNVPDCCYSFWCLPCYACTISKRYGECVCLPLLDIFGCIPPMTVALRASVRQRYGIQGSLCNDCVYSYFCCPCVWCQISREMKTRDQGVIIINQRTK